MLQDGDKSVIEVRAVLYISWGALLLQVLRYVLSLMYLKFADDFEKWLKHVCKFKKNLN